MAEDNVGVKITKDEESKHSFLLISTQEKGKVFEINDDGSVGYTVNGEYLIADNDKKLGIALGQAFETMAKINEESLKEKSAKED